jgi:hypothetical protein
MGTPRRPAWTGTKASYIELQVEADAAKSISMQTQRRRRLADIPLVLTQGSADKGLPKFRQSLTVQNAPPVHFIDQQLQTLLHANLAAFRVHPFRAECKGNSASGLPRILFKHATIVEKDEDK